MKYMRLILIITGFCVLATIVSNFWSNAIQDTNPNLAFSLLTYANTLDGIGLVAVVLIILFGREENHTSDKTGSNTGDNSDSDTNESTPE
jgi:hypothetical protein